MSSPGRGGTIVFNGLPPGSFPAPIFDIVLKGLTIRGSIVGTRQDMVEALDFYGRGLIHPTFHTRGRCDGSTPMCYPAGEFLTGDADELLGVFDLPRRGEVGFWMSKEQFAYWSHTHLTVDVVDGQASVAGSRLLPRQSLASGHLAACR